MRCCGSFFRWFCKPSLRWPLGLLLAAGFVGGVLFWGGFNWAMEATSTDGFCLSCHEMRIPYEEMQQTVHYSNRTGLRASCADCHVPHAWVPKVKRKIEASGELIAWMRGTLDTPEKYEQHRMALAERVWARMEADDSLSCRNCHVNVFEMAKNQSGAAAVSHETAAREGYTCIRCHKGIAHKLSAKSDAENGGAYEF